MNPRTSLTIVGIVIIILGIIPLLGKVIPATSEFLKNIPEAGSMAYQAIIVLIGIIALALSAKKKESAMPQIIMQKQ